MTEFDFSVPSNELEERYQSIFDDVARLVYSARQSAARSVNAVMTATYWLVGRYIVEFEQEGENRANYGTEIVERLAVDLTKQFGRGFSRQNIWQMRLFYQNYPSERILQTLSGESGVLLSKSDSTNVTSKSSLARIAAHFPLPWSAYVRLLSVKNLRAREFYETEALRGGWSVRQLDRQINAQFYERTALSRDKAAMLNRGHGRRSDDIIHPEEEIKDPYVLEFLDLKDEYSERDLEEALIQRLETFLLELGGDFCFMGRQRRLRVGDEWYRMDLLFFHRRLRCLVVIDLKIGRFTPADAGQMHLYLNYVREHWVHEDENPPVGLILCAQKDEAVARYALDGLPNKVMASEYRTTLPDEELLASEIDRVRATLETRSVLSGRSAEAGLETPRGDANKSQSKNGG